MALFNACCWRFPLRTGCTVVAILEIIFEIFLFVFGIHYFVSLVGLAITSLLIYGTRKQKRFWLLSWVVIHVLIIVVAGILYVLYLLFDDDDTALIDFQLLTIYIVHTLLHVIYILVVGSHMCEIREQQEQKIQNVNLA